MLKNFSNKLQHIPKEAAIAPLHKFVRSEGLCTAGTDFFEPSAPKDVAGLTCISLDVSPDQKQKLTDLPEDFQACFATSSKVRQTLVAKHRITVNEMTKPICQHPYRASSKERDIQGKIKEMLQDDIIHPSKRLWAFPVVVEMKDKTLHFCIN